MTTLKQKIKENRRETQVENMSEEAIKLLEENLTLKNTDNKKLK